MKRKPDTRCIHVCLIWHKGKKWRCNLCHGLYQITRIGKDGPQRKTKGRTQ